jgi:hypothetical protein
MIFLLDDDYRVKFVLWHDLAFETRKYYEIAIDFFQIWCMLNNQSAWSTILKNLKKWVINRMYESTMKKQFKIKVFIIQSYLSGIRFYHVNHLYSMNALNHSRLQKILRRGKRLFSIIKACRLSITKSMMQVITDNHSFTTNEVNFDTAFKIAWAGFLRLSEITYSATKLKNGALFIKTRTTRSNISFAENDQYVILRLKRSKIDVDHSEVQIMLIVTNDLTCLVVALRRLFRTDPQSSNASLFRLTDEAFSRVAVIRNLKIRLTKKKINSKFYTRHSFRKGVAQHASNNDMLNENIQRLERWTSNAFRLYFKVSIETRFNLNLNFQMRRSLVISRAIRPVISRVVQSDTSSPLNTSFSLSD